MRANPTESRGASRLCLVGVLTGLALTLSPLPANAAENASPTHQSDPTALQSAFTTASLEFGVPVNVLLSVSYNVSRWEQHGGAPSFSGGYGPMHLTRVDNARLAPRKDDETAEAGALDLDDPRFHTLEAAARLLGVAPEQLQSDPAQNIRGAAALLAQYARYTLGREPTSVADWYGAVALYSGSPEQALALDFADRVYATIREGRSRTTLDGQTVTLTAEPVTPNTDTAAGLALRSSASGASSNTECPQGVPCDFIPAAYSLNPPSPTSYGNYDLAVRPGDGLNIRYIVIHDTEVDYNGTLAIFTNPRSFASAHYVVRSSDGHIAQMVPTRHVAWHAGNWYVNAHSVGVEHEGVAIQGAAWYNEQMYHASARLVRYLAKRFNVPLDRNHIVGHDNIPGTSNTNQGGMHWDPGPFWDWGYYMNLLRGGEGRPDADPRNEDIVEIDPNFQTNSPAMTYCYTSTNCRDVPEQSASFVYLYTAPSFSAPLISNPFITAPGSRANNWANKAVAGQLFYRADHQGDWDAIYFSGQKAWFYNPHRVNTKSGRGVVITPKAGLASIPLFGRAYPEASAYPADIRPQALVPLTPYSIPAGQRYVAEGPFASDYYYSPTYTPAVEGSNKRVIVGQSLYYQVSYNHRFAFVRASDVDVVPAAPSGDGASGG
ncbi:peptidoglycan recognition family protein [Archangium sp.]|uniref:N-acetylmuramoyl-L-alanine amidase n=1 Tax=Archangium sp. TaxID=1872627 RepID=UPI002D5153AA|nr:peptidoglycan recognition family protein [Archangium sp.]HYO52459.1 peptidoglycan recognition family protein [Archangium sp.]